ncbi:hypothetical protein BDA99DRAFT_433258, partial [Phascolomyces articulosus]
YVSAGAKVYISSRSAEACEQVAKALSAQGPGTCVGIPADLQKLEEIILFMFLLLGANWAEDFDTFPDSAFEKVINLNLKRVFSLTQACMPLLTAKSSVDRPSSVINIGSIDGFRAAPQMTFAYTSAKAGLHHLTRHMAGKLGERGVIFNSIAPGAFQSKMMKATLEQFGDSIRAKIPIGRIGTPEDVAGTCIYLSSRAGQYTNGATIVIDGGSLCFSKM